MAGRRTLVDYFEKDASKYLARDEEADVDMRLARREIRKILDEVRLQPPLLDLGFGHGVVAEAVLEKFGECSVVEASSRLIERANERFGSSLTLHHQSFENFAPTDLYGSVLATGVLHHVIEPLQVLRRVAQWVEPGGKIIVSVPNAYSVHRAMGVVLEHQESVYSNSETGKRSGVRHVFSRPAVEELIGAAGLEVKRMVGTYVKVLSNAQMAGFDDNQIETLFDFADTVPLDFHATLVFECERRA